MRTVSIPHRQSGSCFGSPSRNWSRDCVSIPHRQSGSKSSPGVFSKSFGSFNSSQVVWKREERIDTQGKLVQFQFLIGSLEAARSASSIGFPPKFQFLIGSLEARVRESQFSQLLEFQFLIGSLEALSGSYDEAAQSGFNSSQVVWKLDADAFVLSFPESSFNSSQVVWKPVCEWEATREATGFNSSQVVWKLER